MNVSDFTEDHRVIHRIRELQEEWERDQPRVSDIVDEEGHQYVDLVMEGGGVLGIALVGYTWTLEQVGIRFLGVGGTSAGAINALLVAALGDPGEAKSRRTLKALADLEMFSFVDGDRDVEDFVRSMVEGSGVVKLVWKGAQVLDDLHQHLGLNPGDAFLEWLTELLSDAGVESLADLRERVRPPQLLTRDGEQLPEADAGVSLKIVASEVSTETKVVFPDMATLFWKEPENVNPALFARASMSIPFFFHPFRIMGLPEGETAIDRWDELAGYRGELPTEAVFLDGGIMSNFPIDLFHTPAAPPLAPTFGAKLGVDRTEPAEIDAPLELLGAAFDSARHYADYDFLIRNPEYRNLVTFIRTGPHGWLDFFLAEEAKIDLFARGVEAAIEFLRRFDWETYKRIRVELAPTSAHPG